MPFSSFSQFGAALCEVAGVTPPAMVPDAGGVVAFHLVLRDVVVNVVHMNAPPNDDVFILVTFGPMPGEHELQVLQLLAEANFAILGRDAPVLGVNPSSGEVVLRQCVLLSQVDALTAFASLVRLAEIARRWREDPTFAPPALGGVAIAPSQLA